MWLTGGSIALIRIVTIGLRFALTVYITSYLGIAAMGQFGVAAGIAVLIPALVGLGLNFHLCREIAGHDPADTIAMVRDRLAFSVKALAAITIVGLPAYALAGGAIGLTTVLIVAVLWGESLGTDVYLALTGMQDNVLANLAVSLRSASWIPVAIVLGVAWPGLRTLDMVLGCWAAGSFASLAVMAWRLAARGLHHPWRAQPATGWVGRTVRPGLHVWPSDLALVLVNFGDRFILSASVPERALGIYVFIWTFGNMVQTLIQSALITPALPRLIVHFRNDKASWLGEVRRLGLLLLATGLVLAAGGLATIWIGHRFVPGSNFPWDLALGLLIFAGMIARFLSDYLSTVLNSAGAVSAYAGLNVVYAAALLLAIALTAPKFGTVGAAAAVLVVSVLFVCVKAAVIERKFGMTA